MKKPTFGALTRALIADDSPFALALILRLSPRIDGTSMKALVHGALEGSLWKLKHVLRQWTVKHAVSRWFSSNVILPPKQKFTSVPSVTVYMSRSETMKNAAVRL
jgi:hypothetical protein